MAVERKPARTVLSRYMVTISTGPGMSADVEEEMLDKIDELKLLAGVRKAVVEAIRRDIRTAITVSVEN